MQETHSHLLVEGMVLKTAAQHFADELFPLLGIHEKTTVAAPMEQVHLEVKSSYEDPNYMVGEGKWTHLKFESDSVTIEGLQRFRYYKAMTSYAYHVSIMAYVVCFSKVKNILSQLESGINIYRVIPIRLKDKDADRLFQNVMGERVQSQPLGKKDLVPFLPAILMSGTIAQKDRIVQSNQLIQESGQLDKGEGAKMLSMLYALADKFLNDGDLKKVREVLSMARLGQMLYSDGVVDGTMKDLEKGIEAGTRWANQLITHLLRDSRHAGLLRSLEGSDFQELLFKEYHL